MFDDHFENSLDYQQFHQHHVDHFAHYRFHYHVPEFLLQHFCEIVHQFLPIVTTFSCLRHASQSSTTELE